ncbi:MAG: hypothetical protein H8D23_11095 [Candidatus Brocadiales bacterium]|nr:hypothetical protein [Candidatus Brocadiales bacterium]
MRNLEPKPPIYDYNWVQGIISTTSYGGYVVVVHPLGGDARREYWFASRRDAKKKEKLIKECNTGYIHTYIQNVNSKETKTYHETI